jgi:glutathione S-transferase
MTLKLCGFAASNYYNKIKLQLLEKEIPFEEELVWAGHAHETLIGRSPMGKVPFLDTRDGPISESIACAEYIEQTYPHHKLLPAEPYAAAKVRELVLYMELHLELVARELYPQAFFGQTVSEEVRERCHKLLQRGAAALGRLARFDPFVAGPQFTLADCAAIVHLPLVSMASKLVLGDDVLAALPIGSYVQAMKQRPTVRKVDDDRKANSALLMQQRKSR